MIIGLLKRFWGGKMYRWIIQNTPLRSIYIQKFDCNKIIYKGISFNDFCEEAFSDFRPSITTDEKMLLKNDMISAYLFEHVRPDEFLLYKFDQTKPEVHRTYLPQVVKDNMLISYYGSGWSDRIAFIKDKYSFYCAMKRFFKRDAVLISDSNDWSLFEGFCKKHNRFIAKENKGACGVGAHIVEVQSETDVREQFDRLLQIGEWIIEELIVQDKRIAVFNASSINTVRFLSFRHGDNIRQDYPCMRFGRKGCIVDNAGQKGVFVSVDINTGKIISDAFNEHGENYECHPDSGIKFKGFQIPRWDELRSIARESHMSMVENQTYIAFDFALSENGWVMVEANWGDWVLQQTSLQRGLRKEFISLLYNK